MTTANQKRIKSIALGLFIVLLVNVTGIILMEVQFKRNLQIEINSLADKATNMLERIFTFVESANTRISSAANDSKCNDIVLNFQSEILHTPFINGIYVYKNGLQYCQITSESADDFISDTSIFNNEIVLAKNKSSGTPFVLIKFQLKNITTINYINALYIRMILNMLRDGSDMYFKVGNVELNHDGIITTPHTPKDPFLSFSRSSSKYRFTINIETSSREVLLGEFIQENTFLLLGLFTLSIFIGVAGGVIYCKPISIREELMRGVIKKEFTPYYQPIINSATKNVIGVEILMRWIHPEKGLIPPDSFIPKAESTGLIIQMTESIVKSSIEYFKLNEKSLPDEFKVNINISPIHIDDDSLLVICQSFTDTFQQWQLSIELTESMILNHSTEKQERLEYLSKNKVMLSLDDFGTGYSSLATLQAIPFHAIKIDKSFVSKIGIDISSEHIINSIIELASKMGMTVVAEGVENNMQAEYLKNKGVTYLQGYLYGKPMNGENFLTFMSNNQKQMLR